MRIPSQRLEQPQSQRQAQRLAPTNTSRRRISTKDWHSPSQKSQNYLSKAGSAGKKARNKNRLFKRKIKTLPGHPPQSLTKSSWPVWKGSKERRKSRHQIWTLNTTKYRHRFRQADKSSKDKTQMKLREARDCKQTLPLCLTFIWRTSCSCLVSTWPAIRQPLAVWHLQIICTTY